VQVSTYVQVPSPIPGSSFRNFDIFAISADATGGPYDGNVYVAYQTWNPGANAHADIRCATSTDQGATWTQNVLANADDATLADQVQPGIVVDRKGNVNVAFFDRRLDPDNQRLWTWVARSSDGGASFVGHRASDVGWFHKPTEFSGTFIGDYLDVDESAHAVHPFWCDGRTGTQDVYTDVVMLDYYTDVPSISAATGGSANFTINVGPNYAGHTYVMIGSLSGTTPGFTFANGVHVPLNFDDFSGLTLSIANSPSLPGSLGILDGTGSASASFVLPPLPPNYVGFDVDFATVLISGSTFTFATNATRVSIAP
jgi:hypothetical protein